MIRWEALGFGLKLDWYESFERWDTLLDLLILPITRLVTDFQRPLIGMLNLLDNGLIGD